MATTLAESREMLADALAPLWHRQLGEQLDHLDRPATLLLDSEPGRSRLYVAQEGPA